jgi:hypothetical protein
MSRSNAVRDNDSFTKSFDWVNRALGCGKQRESNQETTKPPHPLLMVDTSPAIDEFFPVAQNEWSFTI